MTKDRKYTLKLRVPEGMSDQDVKLFIFSAISTESGFYEPESNESQVQIREVTIQRKPRKEKKPCG